MKKTFTISLVFISISLLCQTDNWKIYNSLNSPLPSNKITSTVVDIEGNMYFGTHKGIVMFDGNSWKNYNSKNSELPSNKVLSISVDNFNNKWIGTSSGLVIYKGGNFEILNTKNTKLHLIKLEK